MPYRRRALPVAVIPVLVVVAVLGYLVGRTHKHTAAPKPPAAARTGHVVLGFPAGWSAVAGGLRIPSLPVAASSAIGPGGSGASAGLLIGTLAPGGLAPLPRQFVAKLRQAPTTEVVNLLEAQAYRYTHLSLPGFAKALTIFVIPNRGGRATALACFAPSASSSYMLACERSIAGVAVTGQLQDTQLTPDPSYAAGISAAITRLDHLRVSLTHDLRPNVSAATAERLARRLASGYSVAASALADLEPSVEAAPVQTALASAIARAHAGYAALAAAAAAQDLAGYQAAQGKVSSAETEVDEALASFALIGYSTATPQGG
jgi:hypothetical protein